MSGSSGVVIACSLGTWGLCAQKAAPQPVTCFGNTWGNACTQATHAAASLTWLPALWSRMHHQQHPWHPQQHPGCSCQPARTHTICTFTAVAACTCTVTVGTWDYTAVLHLQLKGTAIMNRKHKTVGEVVLLDSSATFDVGCTSLQ